MSRKKNDAFAQFIVGLFMIAVIALLCYFTIVVSGVDLLTGRAKRRISVAFAQVGGLKDHDSVMYRGTKVGSVERVQVTATNLIVWADIDEQVVLREGYRISVCNLSMLGGNYLRLEEGEGKRLDLATARLKGETSADWMQEISRVAHTMNDVLSRPDLKNLVSNMNAVAERSRRIAERVDVVVARVERGEGLVGRLLSNDSRLYDGMESTVSNMNAIVDRVNRGQGFAGKLLASDDHLYQDVRESVAAFRKACESFDMSKERGDIRALTASGNKLLANLNTVAERIKNGEGTLGKLTNEAGMYNEVEGLIKDCRQIIDNYRDTTPIATFSSVLTGAL